MKRVTVRSVAAVCVLTMFGALLSTGCSGESEKAPERKTFVAGVNNMFPPMGYKNAAGERVGYDIDLIKEATARLGYELQLYPIVDWDRKEELLRSGEIDCIWAGFTITPERAERILFTPPYLENCQRFLVMADRDYDSVEDLAGKKIGLESESSGEKELKKNAALFALFPDINYYTGTKDAIAALEAGVIEGFVVDSVFAADCIVHQKKPFKMLSGVIAEEQYGIGFRPEDVALRDAVWEMLQRMQTDGTVSMYSRKWFGQDWSVIK